MDTGNTILSSLTNWQTTICGLALIALGIVGMGFAGLDKTIGAGLITGGLGLILAKDGNKSGVPIILLAMVLTIYPACSSSQMDNAMTKTTQVATTCPRPWGR